MCGIAGLFSLRGETIPVAFLRGMTRRLYHRGPDAGGLVLFGAKTYHLYRGDDEIANADGGQPCLGGLGHRRLSIIDLSSGDQPMSDPLRRFWLVYNGEIYNYVDVREQLTSDGFKFATASDTEVLLHSLIRWGPDALSRLEGMFAFALWDQQERRLLLGRDRFGIKPLYYALSGGLLAFASEIKAFFELNLSRTLNPAALRDFLIYRYVPGPQTIYASVQSLPPGHILSICLGQEELQPERWWTLYPQQEREITLAEAADELGSLLNTVCREHLASDVPLGVFLSGGLDSSGTLVYSQANSASRLMAVSVGFRGLEKSKYNELDAARVSAAHVGADLTCVTLDTSLLEVLPNVIEALDEPMADPSALPVYMMMRVARQKVKVMVSGDGGDEVFGGYNRYRRLLRRGKRHVLGNLWDVLTRVFGLWEKYRMKQYLDCLHVMPPRQAEKLLASEFAPPSCHVEIDQRFDLIHSRDLLTRWQLLDIYTYLVDDNLKKVDRMSMACGVEVRVPMLDRRIVEFGLSLPSRLRFDGKYGKVVLRHSLRRHLPADIVTRGKVGFKVPLVAWMQDSRSGLLDDLLAPDRPIWQVLKRPIVLQWVRERCIAKGRHTERLWSLVVLNAWLRHNRLP